MINHKENIKLIALDLDGTLLNSQKELSKENKKALKECISQGIYIVPTTGRTVDGIPDFVKNIPGVRYAITTNGAMVEDIIDGIVIDTQRMSNEQALEILDLVHPYHVMYDAYINRRGVSESRFMNNLDEFKLSDQLQKLIKATRDIVPDIRKYVKDVKKPVEKINLIFAESEERARVRELLKGRKDIVVSSSMSNNLELNSLGATKGDAILRLAEYLGLKRGETMACGDGENDVTMIRKAGIGVVMANGESELKEIADYVTKTNDEDGVAAAIRTFALTQKQ